MEQILYICLGALVALFGGIVTQRIQNYFNQKKEDKDLLYQALCILIAWKEPAQNILEREFKNIVIRIRSRCYRRLASRLFNLPSIENEKKREDEIDCLIYKSSEAMNKPFVKKEIKDMEDLPENEKKERLRMNKPQKTILGITLILMGVAQFIFMGWWGVAEMEPQGPYLLSLLGIVFIGSGFIFIFSKKKK